MRQIMGYFKKVRKFIRISVTPLDLNNMMKQKQCLKILFLDFSGLKSTGQRH